MLTQSDVERYLADHPNPLPRGAFIDGAAPVMTQLRLVPREEAEALGNVSLAGTAGVPAGAPVWYIELHGTFNAAHVSHPHGVKMDGAVYDTAILILDAQSGRELVRGLHHGGMAGGFTRRPPTFSPDAPAAPAQSSAPPAR